MTNRISEVTEATYELVKAQALVTIQAHPDIKRIYQKRATTWEAISDGRAQVIIVACSEVLYAYLEPWLEALEATGVAVPPQYRVIEMLYPLLEVHAWDGE